MKQKFSITNSKNGFGSGTRDNFYKSFKDEVPGPGQYTPKYLASLAGPSFKFGTSMRDVEKTKPKNDFKNDRACGDHVIRSKKFSLEKTEILTT